MIVGDTANTANTCSQSQNSVIHMCESDCPNCDFGSTNTILGNCLNSDGRVAKDNLCRDDISSCRIPYSVCDLEYVCPKITEVTSCGEDGIEGYTTYRLSLILNNPLVKNIYAIYGDDEDDDYSPMVIPPAYQGDISFNNNIGGITSSLINIVPELRYDSWLTIGITDGDTENKLSSVGIDFISWTEDNGITTTNGAVFTMDPEGIIIQGDEYIIAQLTLPNDYSDEVRINAQGKTNCETCERDGRSWKQEGIIFNIEPPTHNNHNAIPSNCVSWYDGCNTCQVNNGILGACTRMMCFREGNPYCLRFDTTGH